MRFYSSSESYDHFLTDMNGKYEQRTFLCCHDHHHIVIITTIIDIIFIIIFIVIIFIYGFSVIKYVIVIFTIIDPYPYLACKITLRTTAISGSSSSSSSLSLLSSLQPSSCLFHTTKIPVCLAQNLLDTSRWAEEVLALEQELGLFPKQTGVSALRIHQAEVLNSLLLVNHQPSMKV